MQDARAHLQVLMSKYKHMHAHSCFHVEVVAGEQGGFWVSAMSSSTMHCTDELWFAQGMPAHTLADRCP